MDHGHVGLESGLLVCRIFEVRCLLVPVIIGASILVYVNNLLLNDFLRRNIRRLNHHRRRNLLHHNRVHRRALNLLLSMCAVPRRHNNLLLCAHDAR
jgi:hypothetical protein